MEEDKIDRSKEYEILGRILVNFENVIEALRFGIFKQMLSLGLDSNEGERPINILLAKLDAYQICEKFRSLHIEIFGKDHLSTYQINILSDCVGQLIEIRNLLLHSTWFIGYSEFSGSEEEVSRGFNDRYGKGGLIRKRIYFSREELTKLNDYMKMLLEFILELEFNDEGKKVIVSKKIDEEDLSKALSFLKVYQSNIEII